MDLICSWDATEMLSLALINLTVTISGFLALTAVTAAFLCVVCGWNKEPKK